MSKLMFLVQQIHYVSLFLINSLSQRVMINLFQLLKYLLITNMGN